MRDEFNAAAAQLATDELQSIAILHGGVMDKGGKFKITDAHLSEMVAGFNANGGSKNPVLIDIEHGEDPEFKGAVGGKIYGLYVEDAELPRYSGPVLFAITKLNDLGKKLVNSDEKSKPSAEFDLAHQFEGTSKPAAFLRRVTLTGVPFLKSLPFVGAIKMSEGNPMAKKEPTKFAATADALRDAIAKELGIADPTLLGDEALLNLARTLLIGGEDTPESEPLDTPMLNDPANADSPALPKKVDPPKAPDVKMTDTDLKVAQLSDIVTAQTAEIASLKKTNTDSAATLYSEKLTNILDAAEKEGRVGQAQRVLLAEQYKTGDDSTLAFLTKFLAESVPQFSTTGPGVIMVDIKDGETKTFTQADLQDLADAKQKNNPDLSGEAAMRAVLDNLTDAQMGVQ